MTDTPILDTHLHLIDRNRLNYPWLANVPDLDRDWSLDSYANEARKVGIASALHMEVDVAETEMEAETAWIEELTAKGSFPIRGIIAAARPESSDFPDWLDRTLARNTVVGLRRVLHVVPDDVSQSDLFRANIRRLAKPDLPFDICVDGRQLSLAKALVDAAPDVRFVLDHCGVPDIEDNAWPDWATEITELAKRPNLVCKVSGVIAYGGPNWTLDMLSRWVVHVTEAFGTDRLVWGGDWPVCTLGGGLSTWVAATRAIVSAWSPSERAALFSGNAERVWRLK